MADEKISAITDGGSPQSDDTFVVVRGAANRRVTVSAGAATFDPYATTAQAAAGVSADAIMNPVLTKNAIETFALRSETAGSISGADKINNAVSLTSAEFAAGSANATTLYFITDAS